MPMTYYIILAMLSEAPERTLRMTELAAIAGTSQSQLSHAATRLEESGWIERRRCQMRQARLRGGAHRLRL